MDLRLSGKKALVTGGTRGLGLAIARRLADEGCALAICARDAEAAERVAAELAAGGAPAFGAGVDVNDAGALERFVADAAAALGGLDLVVANAGGAVGTTDLAGTTAADWHATMSANVVHAATLIRAATPHLEASEAASVLIVASIAGSRPQPRSQYAAAKAAEIALAASLGRELGRYGIRVNSLSPGSTLFPGGSWDTRKKDLPEDFAAFEAREFPFGRLGTAGEIADVAAFLLSPRASWVNGTDVVVDGGQNAPGMAGY